MILQSLAGLPAFLVYFCTALVAVVAYLFVYTRVTPHDEFKLIRENDPAAAIALGLSCSVSCCRWSAQSRMPPMSGIA
jgi:putative membrane protein